MSGDSTLVMLSLPVPTLALELSLAALNCTCATSFRGDDRIFMCTVRGAFSVELPAASMAEISKVYEPLASKTNLSKKLSIDQSKPMAFTCEVFLI